jgi:hypothetical protein
MFRQVTLCILGVSAISCGAAKSNGTAPASADSQQADAIDTLNWVVGIDANGSAQFGSFNPDICTHPARYPNSNSDECVASCQARGLTQPAGIDDVWGQVVGYSWKTSWVKWGADTVNAIVTTLAEGGDVFGEGVQTPPLSKLWNAVSPNVSVALCGVAIAKALIQLYQYTIDSGDNLYTKMSLGKQICGFVYAMRACDDTFKFLPIYPEYVSSGAQAAIGGLSLYCTSLIKLANDIETRATDQACMVNVAAGAPIETARTTQLGDKTYTIVDCCWCTKNGDNWVGVYGGKPYCEGMNGSQGYTACQRQTVMGGRCTLETVDYSGGTMACRKNQLQLWQNGPSGRRISFPAKPPLYCADWATDPPPPPSPPEYGACSCGAFHGNPNTCEFQADGAEVDSRPRPDGATGCDDATCGTLFFQQYGRFCDSYQPGSEN